MDQPTELPKKQLSYHEFKIQTLTVRAFCFSIFAETETGQTRPLKLGIAVDIIKECPDVKRFVVGYVLRCHTSKNRYLRALAMGGARYGIDGKPCGEVSKTHQAHAIEQIKIRMKEQSNARNITRGQST